jgi:chemotaxis protein histidine kinase CheA
VEQLGGTIAVASEVGRGTTFTLRFPLTKARPEQLAS